MYSKPEKKQVACKTLLCSLLRYNTLFLYEARPFNHKTISNRSANIYGNLVTIFRNVREMQKKKILFADPGKPPSLILLAQKRLSKVVPVHTMKAWKGSRSTAPLILNGNTRQK